MPSRDDLDRLLVAECRAAAKTLAALRGRYPVGSWVRYKGAGWLTAGERAEVVGHEQGGMLLLRMRGGHAGQWDASVSYQLVDPEAAPCPA